MPVGGGPRIANADGWLGAIRDGAGVAVDRMFGLRKTDAETAPRGRSGYWGTRAQSGVEVNDRTALAVSTVWRCVNLIANTLSSVPWNVRFRTGDETSELALHHPLMRRFQGTVNAEPMGSRVFRKTLTAHRLITGNGYAEIETARNGTVVALWPIEPDRVEVARTESGKLVYDVMQPRGANVVLDPYEMFHVKGLGYDGLVGYSVVSMARESIGLSMASEQFGASMFGNGAIPLGAFVHPNFVEDEEDFAKIKADIEQLTGPGKAFRTLFLEDGIEWKPIGIPPEDAQFLQTREYQVSDIGPRFFGVPNNFLGDQSKSTLNNFEQMVTMFYVNAMLPEGEAWEEECDVKLLGASGHFTNFNFTRLLRGDMKSRALFYKTMRDLGAWNVDRILAEEDENPIGGVAGTTRLVPAQLVSIERAAQQSGETGRQSSASAEDVDDADEEDEEDQEDEEKETDDTAEDGEGGEGKEAIRLTPRRPRQGHSGAGSGAKKRKEAKEKAVDYTALVLDCAERIVGKESKAWGRASKKALGQDAQATVTLEIEDWAAGFFGESHEVWVGDVVRPLFLTAGLDDDAVELFGVRHCRAAVGVVGTVEVDWGDWETRVAVALSEAIRR